MEGAVLRRRDDIIRSVINRFLRKISKWKYSVRCLYVIPNGTIQHYFQKDTLKFLHQGDEYFLQDEDFIKNSPKIQPPKLVNDALSIYSQLQKNATIYKNIFITLMDRITIWDHSPYARNLCLDELVNSKQAYQCSAVALCTKLQVMDMPKVPLFKTLLDHECNMQDGYRVLYAMLCVYLPRQVDKTKIEA